MNYREIFTDTFKLIWREKKLVVIGLFGSLILALAFVIYFAGAMQGQMSLIAITAGANGEMIDEKAGEALWKSVLVYVASLGVAGLLGLIGYVVNLIARAGIVAEGERAWRGEKVDVGRGMRRGKRKVAVYFTLDMLWVLPAILLFAFVGVMGNVFLFKMIDGGSSGQVLGSPDADFGFLAGVFVILGALFCLSLLYALGRGLFAPLMYQASVIDDLSVIDAVGAGWRLARTHLGSMLIFLMIIRAVQLGMVVILQVLNVFFLFVFMGPWIATMASLQNGVSEAAPAVNGAFIAVAALGIGGVSWLFLSISEVIYLIYYVRIYRELVSQGQSTAPS